MPPSPALTQKSNKFIVFNEFETMDTQNTRFDLAKARLAWLENLQPIGRNRLQSVQGALAALTTLTGETVQRLYFANFNSADYIIAFCVSGAAYQIAISGGASTKFANAGTFTNPDMTQWQSQRILIADPTSGYATWDGTAFVKPGGVSPNITVTAGGSGYAGGATAAISGGSGSGATASVQVVGGIVVGLTLTAAGTGYKAGDTLTVTISPVSGGSGATATAKVWPFFSITPTTLAVFQGRVWLGGARILLWTGTGGYDDSASANASGSTTLPDADLVHQITALRSLNNYLYIFGDNSIKQIGTISVSGSTTNFSIVTLSSDQGTIYPQSIASYNRLIIFANKVGVWAVFGASVEKISDPMDGVFQAVDFTQPLQAALNDINNIHCYLLLVRYVDPRQNGTERSIMLCFMNKKWFVISQSSSLAAICSAVINGTLETFGSSTNDITQLLQNATTSVPFLVVTALSENNEPYTQKRTIRIGVAQSAASPGSVTATSDSENQSLSSQYNVAAAVIWVNNINQQVIWINNSAATVTFTGSGFQWTRYQGNASGLALGASLSGTLLNYTLNGIVIEYQDGPDMVSMGAV